MVHEIPQQRILVIPLGLILGFLYYKTNKLRYCIFLHFCNNFLVFSLLKWPDFFVFEPIYLAISSITFVGMAFFISLFWLINYLDKKN
jgi:membrane protease YdiL (CAAX protease family)